MINITKTITLRYNNTTKFIIWILLFFILTAYYNFNSKLLAADNSVVIYTYRQPFLLKPILEAFEKKTGITTKTLFLKTGLSERLEKESSLSPADLILTVDLSRLTELVDKNLVQAVNSDILEKYIPAKLRDSRNLWFAQSLRARIIYASKKRVPKGAVTNYQDLANPKWKNQICTRSGKHRYNIGLIAALIAQQGKSETKKWLNNVKANLARRPQGNDRAQIKAIYAGECNLSIGNSYYLGTMANNQDNPVQKKWVNAIYPITPNQSGAGTHMNISGMALAKYSPNKKNAIKLMEFFVSKEAQKIYADSNYEFPVRKSVPVSPFLKEKFGAFKQDLDSLSEIARNTKSASELVDEVKFDL